MAFENYHFLNGTKAAGYPAIPVTSGTEILNYIGQTLLDAGWIINDQITDSNYLIAEGTRNDGSKTWVKFADDLTENIEIYGDFYGTNITLSPTQTIPYNTGGFESRLYVSCKEDSGVVAIYNLNQTPNPTMEGGYFGFINPELPSDPYCAYVGLGDVLSPNSCYVMRHYTTNEIWSRPGDNFANSLTNLIGSSSSAGIISGLDYLMIQKAWTSYTSNSGSNPYSHGQNGMFNGLTDKPDALPLFFYEGFNGASNQYNSYFLKENLDCSQPLIRRGYHPFMIAGHANVAMAKKTKSVSSSNITRIYVSLGVGKLAFLVDIF